MFGGRQLAPHPDAPARAVPLVACSWVWQGAGEWAFDFVVGVPPAALSLPAPVEPGRADGLWRSTCFELFLLDPATGGYREFNFSPSGEWAAYEFDSYRESMRALATKTPQITSSNPDQFRLAMHARLRELGVDEDFIRLMLAADPPEAEPEPERFALSAILDDPALSDGRTWIAGICAVIEETDGTKSYWALAHPPGAPDFHHPDCFTLELPASPQA